MYIFPRNEVHRFFSTSPTVELFFQKTFCTDKDDNSCMACFLPRHTCASAKQRRMNDQCPWNEI